MEAKALYRFDASQGDELSFNSGDILKVRRKEDNDWYQAELNGKKGFIPKTYIEMEPHEWYKGNFSRQEAEDHLTNPRSGAPSFDGSFIIRDCQTDKEQFSLTVMHGSKPQHFKILSNPNGTYFLWPEKTFPSINKLIDYHRTVSVARDTNSRIFLRDIAQSCHVQEEMYEAMYDFQSESPEELSFHKGCRIKILDKSDPNWWSGEVVGSKSRERGLLPNNYIKKISP